MLTFEGLPRDVLRAVAKLGGEYGEDCNGDEVVTELRAMGHDVDPLKLRDVFARLKATGHLEFHAGSGGVDTAYALIHLGPAGLQAVAGWPREGSLSDAQVGALLAAIEAREATAAPEDKARWRAFGSAIREVGTAAAGEVLAGWMKSAGIAP